ncbi:methylated-DNA--protein-cysteine methyltransferase [Alphaproteobacteria bacterium]|nr:methylated-DNA--protein-cysteine methyltransferase [Alphaproteobacteria bacterium]
MKLDFMEDWPEERQKEVHEYLAGKRKVFDAKPEPVGTEFQKAVWAEMSKIPYGQTRTYTEIAVAIGRPKAVRAVGTACGKNPFPIIIPCHRVVAKNGLGGYLYGLEMKKQLLDLENVKY